MRKIIKYIHWLPLIILGAWALLANTAWGIDMLIPTPVKTGITVDSIRYTYIVTLPDSTSPDTVVADSLVCTSCDSSYMKRFVQVGGDTLHIWEFTIWYPGNNPVNMTYMSDQFLKTPRQGDGNTLIQLGFVDTCTPAVVQGVIWTINDSTGVTVDQGVSNSTGTDTTYLKIGNVYNLVGIYPAGYLWNNPEVITVDSAGQPATQLNGCAVSVPGAAADPNYVTLYFDVGSGIIDSTTGAMIARTGGFYKLNLIGEVTLMGGGWLIVPKEQKKKPDASGRVQFFIPANTIMTPIGSYYQLSTDIKDGFMMSNMVIRNFIVDTIPDPILLDSTTEVSPR